MVHESLCRPGKIVAKTNSEKTTDCHSTSGDSFLTTASFFDSIILHM